MTDQERLEALERTAKWHKDQAEWLRAKAEVHETQAKKYDAMIPAKTTGDNAQ